MDEEQEQSPEQPEERAPEQLQVRPMLRVGLLVFGTVVFVFGVLSLFGGRFEYANFVGQQVVAPLAIVVGAIMFFAGARGRIWS
jgi:H+/gluconate symporter-like permease